MMFIYKHSYHVITPLSRYENLRHLIRMLAPMGVHWHVITDDDEPFRVSFEQPWITHYIYHNCQDKFWSRCNAAINWMLDLTSLVPGDRYCFLNDDDAYEPEFFKKVDAVDGELIVVSMDRGHHTPSRISADQAHGTHSLIAEPGNMKPGYVGIEQVVVSGRIQSVCRLPMHIAGDGQMIEWMVAHYPAVYVPAARVWFNHFEPGRWDKA